MAWGALEARRRRGKERAVQAGQQTRLGIGAGERPPARPPAQSAVSPARPPADLSRGRITYEPKCAGRPITDRMMHKPIRVG